MLKLSKLKRLMQNEILEITKKLITFKTIDGNNKEIAACFDFIKKYFVPEIKSGKIIVKEYEKNGIASLVLANRETLKPDIILNGHIDVVDADKKDFIPKVINDKLYGRGAADMKSEVAAMMVIFKEAVNEGIKKPIALMLTSDEETSSQGAKYLLNEIGYRGKVAIVPDGGQDFKLIIKEKGGYRFRVISQGKSAHASRSWLGENAILKLINFYKDLEKLFPPLKRIKRLYQDGVSLNLGKIAGGKSINVVPDTAEMYLDIRYSEKSDKRKIIRAVKYLTKRYKLDFEIIKTIEIMDVNPKNYYLKRFKDIVEEILKRPIKITKWAAASDARFFSSCGIPVIIMAPNCGNKHGENEWVKIKSLEKFYEILKEFIIK